MGFDKIVGGTIKLKTKLLWFNEIHFNLLLIFVDIMVILKQIFEKNLTIVYLNLITKSCLES